MKVITLLNERPITCATGTRCPFCGNEELEFDSAPIGHVDPPQRLFMFWYCDKCHWQVGCVVYYSFNMAAKLTATIERAYEAQN